MTKMHFSKALALLAAVCITAGCDGGAVTETTTSAGTAVTEQTSTSNQQEISPEISELEALEVDYVDEYGRIYYKNPTIWTQEKVFQELTINGQKFEAPLTLEKLGDGYSYSTEGAFYDENTRTACLRLMYNDISIAWVYLDNCDNIDDIIGKEYNKIQFDLIVTDEQVLENIEIADIGLNSSQKEIISCLGSPTVATESYFIYTESLNLSDVSYTIPGEKMVFYFNGDELDKTSLFSIIIDD